MQALQPCAAVTSIPSSPPRTASAAQCPYAAISSSTSLVDSARLGVKAGAGQRRGGHGWRAWRGGNQLAAAVEELSEKLGAVALHSGGDPPVAVHDLIQIAAERMRGQ